MAITNHDTKDINNLESEICKDNGEPLYGEIDMYRRIYSDCENSPLHWHFWHDLRLPIAINKQSEIQIDFFLVCEKGAIVIEVKGGDICILNGGYYYSTPKEGLTPMERTPFKQADDYKHALMKHKILQSQQLFIDSVCAFPHTDMDRTGCPNLDLGYKLWSKKQQGDSSRSFADFCEEVLEEDKTRKNWHNEDLNEQELEIAIRSLKFTDPNYEYVETSYQTIMEWLDVRNLETFKSLEKNERLIIEGGPGTGKTTIAKAFIRRYSELRGIYLCWTNLLAATFEYELEKIGLKNCEVYQYESFFRKMDPDAKYVSHDDFMNKDRAMLVQKLHTLLIANRGRESFVPYDYVIIDEAQDTFDKGASEILDTLTSIRDFGIGNGRYLVFYDTEQGYNKESRQLDEYAPNIAQYGAHFVLNENHRVQTNIQIVDEAKLILGSEDSKLHKLIEEIEKKNDPAIQILHFADPHMLITYLRSLFNTIRERNEWGDYVLLTDSKCTKPMEGEPETLYDRLAGIKEIEELNTKNVMSINGKLALTTSLKYKGLEKKHVLMILKNKNKNKDINKFELYIGMTRAILDVKLLLLD